MDVNFTYLTVLVYIFNRKGEVLLQKKARGFGKGKWNGPGGKINQGEAPEEAARREVKEETTLKIKKIEPQGIIEFVFPHKIESSNYCYVYICRDFSGKPFNTGEGELKWFKTEELPLEEMWDDDRYWLPSVLAGEKVHIRFYFDKNEKVSKIEKL